ncbi:hypothetical protein [Sphingobium sp. Ant17]|uniref:hypothetical protein n=1 Tax=Sphingobium sp. Ant17 TaxID=1461752 RepID=UPI001F16F182|nr:hypothetical protein [Sphingobium sp. Ant17]
MQAGQRGAQVVGYVARHLAQVVHQSADPVEHPVERRRHAIEFVTRAGERHTSRQIAIDDREGGAVDVR